jgi:8-oxo-dGTP pyrophosphatase MutT (NUDIX family)
MRPGRITAGVVRDRLGGAAPAPDPRRLELDESRRWPRAWQGQGAAMTPAGVLMPLVRRSAGLSVLLTRRSADLKHHAGQVSFPGGRMEAGDADILATALRETEEEIGVAPGCVEVAGTLRSMPTISGYVVTPVVGLLPGDVRLTLDPIEVERAFEVPLEFFFDEANATRTERVIEGVTLPLIEYFYGGERIWGATASMIEEFKLKIINNNKL